MTPITVASMITLKADHPRSIDRVIDYFGERHAPSPQVPPRPGKAAPVRAA
jgi:hypothetical protein